MCRFCSPWFPAVLESLPSAMIWPVSAGQGGFYPPAGGSLCQRPPDVERGQPESRPAPPAGRIPVHLLNTAQAAAPPIRWDRRRCLLWPPFSAACYRAAFSFRTYSIRTGIHRSVFRCRQTQTSSASPSGRLQHAFKVLHVAAALGKAVGIDIPQQQLLALYGDHIRIQPAIAAVRVKGPHKTVNRHNLRSAHSSPAGTPPGTFPALSRLRPGRHAPWPGGWPHSGGSWPAVQSP